MTRAEIAPALTPYPRGWYVAEISDQLPRGAVRPFRAFGRDLVAFRTEDGTPHVVDAHCPHMGAHLGHGGTVLGDRIRCPFHGWEFAAGDGRCARIPSGDPIPARAHLTAWPVCETAGFVFVWFHERKEPPAWSISALPDFEDLDVTPFRTFEWTVRTVIQDISENDADVSHAPALHGFVDHPAGAKLRECRHECDWLLDARFFSNAFGVPSWAPFPEFLKTTIEIRRSGLCLGWVRLTLELPLGILFRPQTFAMTTPIDERSCRVILRHRLVRTRIPLLDGILLRSYVKTFNRTFEQDIRIWENKIYRMHPAASKTDSSILQFRRWTRQFYPPGTYEAALAGGAPQRPA